MVSEKPVTLSSKDLQEMMDAAERTGNYPDRSSEPPVGRGLFDRKENSGGRKTGGGFSD